MNIAKSPFAPTQFPDMPSIKGVKVATASRGFYAARGIERDDVFLAVFDNGTTTGGVFTLSSTASDDVLRCRAALKSGDGRAQALIVNSGNSNAFTGPKGALKNAATLTALETQFGYEESGCFIAATGVIGEPLPNPNYIGEMVPVLAERLGAPNWEAMTRAFMTTDTFAKAAWTSREIDGQTVNFVGIAKGSGMIAPNMATMLAYIFTDAAIAPEALQKAVAEAADLSFNAITVDGDTSTSDTFMAFATGGSGGATILQDAGADYDSVCSAITEVASDLAKAIVKDGEGAQKFITIGVKGAADDRSAKVIAAAIANSPLVKTALAASDANWGRIVMAVGKSGEPVDVEKLSISFGDLEVARNGARSDAYDEAAASRICAEPYIDITVDVGVGSGAFTVYTCDLTHAYIDINGAYRT